MSATFNEDQLAAGRRLFNGSARFRLGVAQLEQLPPVDRVEIAFAGRSNVGKSSLINGLTGVNGLARASNTPGRTRELNYFDLGGDALTLVDMPGYGYAKAAKKDVKQWQGVLKGYLRGRVGLARAFVLIDSRHGCMTPDFEMFDMLDDAAVPYQLVITKCDKINRHELAVLEAETMAHIKKRAAALQQVHLTAAERGFGMDELRAEIAGLVS
ncbi:ribosome biogenesis GTP-binding protein YihA/YsxC [Aestuariivirga litoralis]|uniref:ribosome biogenesis GTP-binding protein YihA/YsxC n=1 Tax=Aestuariivirga litoralis TaxID=2650924 RepID=UPI0018C5465F|nr:YihA family ribosome biogenesis GTP-binding protein [Aestuariivirga litoralis]